MAVFGLGLAALGQPTYLDIGHGADLGPDRSVEAVEARFREVCDASWAGGIRWFDAARSYGLAEEFLRRWLIDRGVTPAEVTVSSKWGYSYIGGWRADAAANEAELKDLRASVLARQWPSSRDLLGPWLGLYQVHSATLDTGVLGDAEVHRALAGLGIPVGLSLSGPEQPEALRQALGVTVDGRPLFSAVQATWNLLEPSVGPALAEAKREGWTVIVKEPLANGRLTTRALRPLPAALGERPDVTALSAALAQPWADVVLIGAGTLAQLHSNLDAAGAATAATAAPAAPAGPSPEVAGKSDPAASSEPDPAASSEPDRWAGLAQEPGRYWAERAAMPWT